MQTESDNAALIYNLKSHSATMIGITRDAKLRALSHFKQPVAGKFDPKSLSICSSKAYVASSTSSRISSMLRSPKCVLACKTSVYYNKLIYQIIISLIRCLPAPNSREVWPHTFARIELTRLEAHCVVVLMSKEI